MPPATYPQYPGRQPYGTGPLPHASARRLDYATILLLLIVVQSCGDVAFDVDSNANKAQSGRNPPLFVGINSPL